MSEKDNKDVLLEDFGVKYNEADEEKHNDGETKMMDDISEAINAKLIEFQQEELVLEEAGEKGSGEHLKQKKPEQNTEQQKIIQQNNAQQRYNQGSYSEGEKQQESDEYKNPAKGEYKSTSVNSGANRKSSRGSGGMSSNRKRSTSSGNPRSGPPARSHHVAKARKTKKKSKAKRNLIIFTVFIFLFAVAYCGVAFYFSTHFLFNTHINGQNVSTLTPAEVRGHINNTISDYSLTIVKRGGDTEVIRGVDIDLAYYDTGEIQALLDNQNVFAWPLSFIFPNSIETPIGVVFDEDALDRAILNTRAVSTDQVSPVSAWPVFNGLYYEIEPEVMGSTLDIERMKYLIREAVTGFLSEINLEHENLYEVPQFTTESYEVINARDTMNTFLNASITYTMDEDIVIDSLYIRDWVTLDDELNAILYEDRVASWVGTFADSYDTVGTTRYLSTPLGREVSVSGGFYGWRMDREAETLALINNIRQGDVVTREPIYEQRGAVHEANDWGNTFIQVDLYAQIMWFFQDGEMVLESPVVTGLPGSMATPSGVFFIVEMLRDTILEGAVNPDTGEEANPAPVEYWMRVTWEGIGFHDASWQESFGGDRYQTFGSHGCINMPLEEARQLFALIDIYTPVVIHQ